MLLSMAVLLFMGGSIQPLGAQEDHRAAHHDMNENAMDTPMTESHDVITGAPFDSHDMDTHETHDMNTHGTHDMNTHETHDMNTHGTHDMNTDAMAMPPAKEAADSNNQKQTQAASPKAHDHTAMQVKAEEENLFKSVGLDEKLGETIPLDISFLDETGKPVTLAQLVDRPTLVQLVFYHCPQTCNMMMANLAHALPSVTFKPGTDYRVVTISFDHEDTPLIASESKKNYMNLLPPAFPVDQWRFLTGSLEAIRQITVATGFRFKRVEQHNFVHPNVLIVLGENGKIIRYLYGVEYLPFDVSMAITEATRGTPAISIKKILTYCFDYDPKGKKYVFKTFRVTGIALILILGAFYLFVLRKGNRK